MAEFQSMADHTVANEAVKLFAANQVRSELVLKDRSHLTSETVLVSSPVVVFNRATALTASRHDRVEHNDIAPPLLAQASQADILDPLCRNRTTLLVRKYVGAASVEDSARFEILTQRLRRLDPRVSTEQFAALDTMISRLEASSAEMDEIDQMLERL